MNHHLEHALNSSRIDISKYCQPVNWKDIESRVNEGILNSELQKNISILVNSAINSKINSYLFLNNLENKPLVGMEEYKKENTHRINKNSMIIKNKTNNKDYILDCLDYPFRSFIPMFNSTLPLGSIVSGIYYEDIEKAKECYKFYLKNTLQELSNSLSWFNNSIIKDSDLNEEYQKKFLERDLEELRRNIGKINTIAIFNLEDVFCNLNDSLSNLIKKDIVNTENIKETKEYKRFTGNLNNTIKLFNNFDVTEKNKKHNKKRVKP
tara:strand:- start:1925 stop:2722 length:798 start_codon:yes stop_codon:yes gene_type:complete